MNGVLASTGGVLLALTGGAAAGWLRGSLRDAGGAGAWLGAAAAVAAFVNSLRGAMAS